jgi:hypothetical protein
LPQSVEREFIDEVPVQFRLWRFRALFDWNRDRCLPFIPPPGGSPMKKLIACSTIIIASTFAFAGVAEAKGCIKGAIVGGIAGKMAGHGKIGAAAGCAIGHHRAAKKPKS